MYKIVVTKIAAIDVVLEIQFSPIKKNKNKKELQFSVCFSGSL